MRFSVGLTACLLLVATPAGAQLSARARMFATGRLSAGALADTAGTRARVTVRVPGGADALSSLGFTARALSSDVAAVELDADGLAFIARTIPEARVEPSQRLKAQLDRATQAIGAPLARQESGASGRGVLIGVVDTGIDFRHADLRNLDGSSRVQALLDHRTPADGRHAELGAFGGAIWHKDELDALLASEAAGTTSPIAIPQLDRDGHGTHVASLAASNGLATGKGLPNGRYVGVAPQANLLIAQTSGADGTFTDVDVLDACRFLIAERAALRRPLVVNISLGGTGGPHDGSTNLEHALDDLFPRDQPGLALTVAAGNLGLQDLHAGGWSLRDEQAVTLHLDGGGTGSVPIELWYRGELSFAIESPSGRRSSWVDRGEGLDITFDGEGRALVENGGGPLPSGLVDGAIVLQGAGAGRAVAGDWKLVVRGRALRWDAWLGSSPLDGLYWFTDHVVPDGALTVPATARSAISVGSVISRFDWVNVDGLSFVVPGTTADQIGTPSLFSGMGPTSDGRFAPDVAAPGEFIFGAMSRDATPTSPASVFRAGGSDLNLLWSDDGVHGALRGTSQAAPIIAGVIALLFEVDPTLTSESLREILRVTAAPVGDTAGWSPRVGFGQVDARAAVAYVRGVHGTTVDANASPVGVSRDLLPPQSEETTVVTVTPRDAAGRPLGSGQRVTIALSAGEPLGDVVDVGSGRYQRAFVAHAARGVTGVVSVTVNGVALTQQPRVFFVTGRNEVGGALVPGGGCNVGGLGTGDATPTAAVIAILLVARRRRRISALGRVPDDVRPGSPSQTKG